MKNVMGIIHHLKNEDSLQEITRHRCIASAPFGGRYRLVDFVLSNMVNAGMCNIGIMTSLNLRSLVDHVGSGKDWGLDKKHDGLFILPTASSHENKKSRKVDLEDFYVNLDYIQRSRQKYLIISGTSMVCNIDYRKAFQFHLQQKADITVIYKELSSLSGYDGRGNVFLETSPDQKITAVQTRPTRYKRKKVSMDMYIMEKGLLVEILKNCAGNGKWDFIRDVLARETGNLSLYGYAHRGYLAIINSVNSYYRHHMDLLTPEIWQELFYSSGLIYTKMKDGPPAKYHDTADVRNTLVGNGCMIEGKVENSVLYRNVKVGRGALVRNSIIMPRVEIEEDAVLDGVILDKDVHVRKGARLVGEKELPVVVEKRSVI